MERAVLSLKPLFIKFFKLGATAYGGPAMIGQIKQTIVNERNWIKEEEFLKGLGLCQLIPGATMVQMVTYIGYRLRGIRGALISAIAFILPAFLSLLILSSIYFKIQTHWLIQALFKGSGAMVVALVLNAGITLGKSILKDWKVILICVLSFFGFLFRWNILLIFLFASMAAILLYRQIPSKEISAPEGFEQKGVKKEDYLFAGMLVLFIAAGLVISHLFDPLLASLFLRLSKIGALAFGGGYTAIPLIQYEVVDRFEWLTTKEFLDGIAMGQVTPGPILITATFIGFKLSGLLGALVATVGIFSSSFFILVLFIPYYDRLRKRKVVKVVERGILASFIAMLGLVLFNFGRTAFVDLPSVILSAATFFALLKKIPLPYILLSGGILSVIIFGLLK